MDDDLYFDDSPLVHFQHIEGETLVFYAFSLYGELSLYLEKQAGQRLCFALDVLEIIVIKAENLREVRDERLCFEEVGVLVKALIGFLLIVVFVVYLAHDFLQDVLHRDDSAGASELIHNDGDVDFVCLEVAKQAGRMSVCQRNP